MTTASFVRALAALGSSLLLSAGASAQSIKLNPPLQAGTDVGGVVFSPSEAWVAYRANIAGIGLGIHTVRPDGRRSTLRSAPGFIGTTFAFSPDGARLLYTRGTSQSIFLESVPVFSGPPLTLDLASPMAYSLFHFAVPPAGSRVVYHQEPAYRVSRLMSAPIAGGAPTQLNGPLTPPLEMIDFVGFDADGSRVAYVVGMDLDGFVGAELRSVPIEGGADTLLFEVERPCHLVDPCDFLAPLTGSPDGQWLVFSLLGPPSPLFSVPFAGGPVVPVAPDGGSFAPVLVSADSSRVVFAVGSVLSSVPISGGAPTQLSAGVDTFIYTFGIAPGSDQVVYLGREAGSSGLELYRVAIAGGMPVSLSGPLVAGGRVHSIRFTPDGSRVVYAADQDADEVVEIYSVPLAGGPVTVLSPPLVAGGDASVVSVTPDGRHVVVGADAEVDGMTELYSVRVTGGAARKLNGPLVAGGDVSSPVRFSPDDMWVTYRADQDTDEVVELYSSRLLFQCNDGIDNDSDLAIDHPADPECASETGEWESGFAPACGLGPELVGVVSALGWARRRRRTG